MRSSLLSGVVLAKYGRPNVSVQPVAPAVIDKHHQCCGGRLGLAAHKGIPESGMVCTIGLKVFKSARVTGTRNLSLAPYL